MDGKNVLIAAHGNSLRSIIMYLDKLTPDEVGSIILSIILSDFFPAFIYLLIILK